MGNSITTLRTGPIAVNTYFIPLYATEGVKSVLVVDPAGSAFSGDEDTVVQYLNDNGDTPAGIVLTHGHFDHILGIAPLVKAFGALPVAVAEADEAAITDESLAFHAPSLEMMGDDGRLASALMAVIKCGKCVLPYQGITLADVFDNEAAAERNEKGANDVSSQMHSALSQWQVIPTPGHTMGSVCLYNKAAGWLLSGDTMFYQGWGRTDLGGSEVALMRSLKLLRKTISQDTLVYPGHDRYGFAIRENY